MNKNMDALLLAGGFVMTVIILVAATFIIFELSGPFVTHLRKKSEKWLEENENDQ